MKGQALSSCLLTIHCPASRCWIFIPKDPVINQSPATEGPAIPWDSVSRNSGLPGGKDAHSGSLTRGPAWCWKRVISQPLRLICQRDTLLGPGALGNPALGQQTGSFLPRTHRLPRPRILCRCASWERRLNSKVRVPEAGTLPGRWLFLADRTLALCAAANISTPKERL